MIKNYKYIEDIFKFCLQNWLTCDINLCEPENNFSIHIQGYGPDFNFYIKRCRDFKYVFKILEKTYLEKL